MAPPLLPTCDANGFVSELELRSFVERAGWEAITIPALVISELRAEGARADGSDLGSRATLDRDSGSEVEWVTGGDPARYRNKLAFLRKRPGNPFPNVISIGRALGCDLVVALATVSKLQGYFSRSEAGEWSYLDQRSLNGSRLNGRPLEPNTLYELADGDQISIADEVVLTFVTPESLPERVGAR